MPNPPNLCFFLAPILGNPPILIPAKFSGYTVYVYMYIHACTFLDIHVQGDGGESSDLKFKDDGTTLEELLVHLFVYYVLYFTIYKIYSIMHVHVHVAYILDPGITCCTCGLVDWVPMCVAVLLYTGIH